jgi:hypothetical protein
MALQISAGYTTYTGYTLLQHEADSYNRMTAEINRERYEPTRQFLLDQRHRLFVSFCDRAAK